MKTTQIKNVPATTYRNSHVNFGTVLNCKKDGKLSKVLNTSVVAGSTINNCKDYIQDEYYHNINSKTNLGLDENLDKIRLLVVIPNKHSETEEELENTTSNILDLVNQTGKALGIENKTIAYKIKDINNKIEIIGDQEWLRGSSMVSLFMTLIRVGTSHVEGNNYLDTLTKISHGIIEVDHYSDKEYVRAARAIIKLYTKYGYKNFYRDDLKENWTNNKHRASSHVSGIYGLYNFLSAGTSYSTIDEYPRREELVKEIEEKEGKNLKQILTEFYNEKE